MMLRNFHIYQLDNRRYGIVHDGITEDGDTIRMLNVGGAVQSASYIGPRWAEPVFEYYRVFDNSLEPFLKSELQTIRTLMLGAGCCSWPKHALDIDKRVMLDAVESNASVIGIGRSSFGTDALDKMRTEEDEKRFQMIHSDCMDYLVNTNQKYHVIINDVFDGRRSNAALLSLEGLRLTKMRLAEDGVYALNAVTRPTLSGFNKLQKIADEVRRYFSNVLMAPAADRRFGSRLAENHVLFATDADHEFPNATAI